VSRCSRPWQEVLDKLELTVEVEIIKLELTNVNVFKKRTSTEALFFYFLKPHFKICHDVAARLRVVIIKELLFPSGNPPK